MSGLIVRLGLGLGLGLVPVLVPTMTGLIVRLAYVGSVNPHKHTTTQPPNHPSGTLMSHQLQRELISIAEENGNVLLRTTLPLLP